MTRVREISRVLKNYDRCLYAQETKPGRVDIYRKSECGMSPPNFIFSLTDTSTAEGTPVPYGSEVVLNRIKAHDLWRDDEFVEKWISEKEKDAESKERALKNSIESFLYEFRRPFMKATSDINTANLNKVYRKGL